MSLFDSSDPAIGAAHAKVLDTLANIETEYGAVFVVDEYQQELRNAVAANHRRSEESAQFELMRRKMALKAKRTKRPAHRAVVVDLDGKRVA